MMVSGQITAVIDRRYNQRRLSQRSRSIYVRRPFSLSPTRSGFDYHL